MSKWKVFTVEGFDNSTLNPPKDNSEHVARQEQVQCAVEVPQVTPIDDQIPMDSVLGLVLLNHII